MTNGQLLLDSYSHIKTTPTTISYGVILCCYGNTKFVVVSGIVAAPLILFTVKEPKHRRNLIADSESTEIKLSFWSRLLLLIRTFIMPGMFFLCLASGVRNAGGYVWAYNTELFFEANDLSRNQISKFMSWIPLVGGSIGAVVGGIISDMLVKGRSPYMRVWVLIVSQV